MTARAIASCSREMIHATRSWLGPSMTMSMTLPMRNIAMVAYIAFSSENTEAETATTMRSVIVTHVPTGMGVWRARIWQMMSVPPVLLPARNTMPSPTPHTTPPHREASSRSSAASTGSTGAVASMSTLDKTMPASERST